MKLKTKIQYLSLNNFLINTYMMEWRNLQCDRKYLGDKKEQL